MFDRVGCVDAQLVTGEKAFMATYLSTCELWNYACIIEQKLIAVEREKNVMARQVRDLTRQNEG